jgi:hypothetical protein
MLRTVVKNSPIPATLYHNFGTPAAARSLARFLLRLALKMPEHEWEPVTKKGLAGFAAGLGVFLLALWYSEPGFILILDHANLLFHEAGHPIVGLFSARLEPYGGTLGQMAFPVVLVVSCWRKGQPFGVAAAGLWFFENALNIARYMADARALELPLVGGGDHDWNTILSRWGLLQWDIQLAAGLRIVAWLGIAASCGWLGWRAWQDRNGPQARQTGWLWQLEKGQAAPHHL